MPSRVVGQGPAGLSEREKLATNWWRFESRGRLLKQIVQPSGKPWTDPFELGERPFFCRKMGCFFRPSKCRPGGALKCQSAMFASRLRLAYEQFSNGSVVEQIPVSCRLGRPGLSEPWFPL